MNFLQEHLRKVCVFEKFFDRKEYNYEQRSKNWNNRMRRYC